MKCTVCSCAREVHAHEKCLKHYEAARRQKLKNLPCVENCGKSTWRRKRCRGCYKNYMRNFPHCHMPKCHKPIYFKLKCQFHFRTQFESCLRCNSRIYSGNYCRHCYECRETENFSGDEVCIVCAKKTYMDMLCIHHYTKKHIPSKSCYDCKLLAVHQGKCVNHLTL